MSGKTYKGRKPMLTGLMPGGLDLLLLLFVLVVAFLLIAFEP
jgi:hypothetical protein